MKNNLKHLHIVKDAICIIVSLCKLYHCIKVLWTRQTQCVYVCLSAMSNWKKKLKPSTRALSDSNPLQYFFARQTVCWVPFFVIWCTMYLVFWQSLDTVVDDGSVRSTGLCTNDVDKAESIICKCQRPPQVLQVSENVILQGCVTPRLRYLMKGRIFAGVRISFWIQT